MAKKSFETRVKEERKRLLEVFSGMDEKRLAIVQGVIDEAAFQRISLQELKEDIRQNGETEPFSQGKEEPYLRETPCSKKYEARAMTYLKYKNLLLAQLPKEERDAAGDAFDEF